MRLLFGARWMQTVCLSSCPLHELLTDKDCRLSLCFAPTPSGISDQSNKLAAALHCEAHAICFSVWPALAVASACRQRLPPSTLLLCTESIASPTNRASLWLLFGARWMQTVCLSCRHSCDVISEQPQACLNSRSSMTVEGRRGRRSWVPAAGKQLPQQPPSERHLSTVKVGREEQVETAANRGQFATLPMKKEDNHCSW